MHIETGSQKPGIVGLFEYSPATAEVLSKLAEVLLRSEDRPIPKGERELLAAYVSKQNGCEFCYRSHRAFAEQYLGKAPVGDILDENRKDALGRKFMYMLSIASLVTSNATLVTTSAIQDAKNNGMTDREVHDVVLIAAAFNMFNRYVSGLGVDKPTIPEDAYDEMAEQICAHGYVEPKMEIV